MRPLTRPAVLAGLASVLLLSGCSPVTAPEADRRVPPTTPGPTATATAAPDEAARTAGRYRRSGGTEDVYGILRRSGPEGVPALTVWTRDPDSDAERFDALRASVTGYLEREEGLSFEQGYLMDVFGPDGSLRHRLDARR
ncbi:hypothetical protein [Streptomyces sp. WAC08241]|uniref:hypothetical protein n=1 Tax=Streptomyces sp. WAC08241 TaxID=2487421 RepID=UPI000F78B8B7|nr:hypothetical protein [Streptomyces sp. WAC08241]RSS39021.1 hypothetical protein EF906_19810 [Streptomyces sp. WAC08241]